MLKPALGLTALKNLNMTGSLVELGVHSSAANAKVIPSVLADLPPGTISPGFSIKSAFADF